LSNNFVVHDSSDEQQVKKAQALQEDKDRDLMFVLKEERGRRFLYEIIFNDCHMMANSHVPASSDSSAYNEGARQVGIALFNRCKEASKSHTLTMLEENHFDE
tara:strand:+ start:3540 stop:3848 length:309 start_codon:yes stop_codon:yes gene_type:complete